MLETVKVFLETIFTELIAGILLIAIGGLLSRKARWVSTAALGRLLDVDVEYVFRNKREADEDLQREIKRSTFIYLLTGRGNELQRETFAKVRRRQRPQNPIGRLRESER